MYTIPEGIWHDVEAIEADGFWDVKHAVPSKPELIVGNKQQFNKDLVRTRERIERYLNQIDTDRWMIWHSLPDAYLNVDKWARRKYK